MDTCIALYQEHKDKIQKCWKKGQKPGAKPLPAIKLC